MATLDKDDKKWLKKNLITRSNGDINAIKGIVKVALEEAIDEKQLVTKDDISHLPSKDDFFTENSKLMKELQTIRLEQKAISKQASRNAEDIEKLKEIHPKGKYPMPSKIASI